MILENNPTLTIIGWCGIVLRMINKNIIGGGQVRGQIMGLNKPNQIQQPRIDKPEGDKTTRIATFTSDKSGCAHYRVIWPNYVLNSTKEYLINDMKKITIRDDAFFHGLDVIRFQRQVSNEQFQMFKWFRQNCDKNGVRLMYELDDIPLYEDIPLYNKNRKSYARDDFRSNIINMMEMSDEITVSTQFMKEYFRSKVKNTKITHVPNYIPKFWMDRYYNEDQLKVNFSKNKKKPRILYAGSASHYALGSDVEDDFTKLVDYVKKTLKDYQWVFFGGLPRPLIPLYKEGKIEFHNYSPVVTYPETFKSIKPNVCIAPLIKNNFNRAKSHIKLTESAAYGIPCVCQSEIEPYGEAIYTFDTASELDDQIKKITRDAGEYMKACRKSRQIVEGHWLENNLDTWDELYRLPFGHKDRINLNKINV